MSGVEPGGSGREPGAVPPSLPAPASSTTGSATPGIEEPAVERVPRSDRTMAPDERRRRMALAVALVADLAQWAAFPLFMSGALSPWDDVLDVAVGLVMLRLVGWHWAFLPTFLAELVPFVDLVPSWTLAWWIATRRAPRTAPPTPPR